MAFCRITRRRSTDCKAKYNDTEWSCTTERVILIECSPIRVLSSSTGMQLLTCKKSDYYSSHCSGRETLHDGQKFLLETLARKSCKCWWIHKRVILDNRTDLQMQRPINHEIMSTVNCNLECVHMCLCGYSNPFLSVCKVSLPPPSDSRFFLLYLYQMMFVNVKLDIGDCQRITF